MDHDFDNTIFKKRAFEALVSGMRLDPQRWNEVGPRPDETLTDAAQIYAWVAEHEGEITELLELRGSMTSPHLAATTLVRSAVSEARLAIFDSERYLTYRENEASASRPVVPPPFANVADAYKWLESESMRAEGASDAETYVWEPEHRSPSFRTPPGLSPPMMLLGGFTQGIKYDFSINFVRLLLELLPETSAVVRPEHPPLTRFTLELALLYRWSQYLSYAVGSAWTLLDCRDYILAGQLPELPSMRVQRKLAGISIDLYVPLTKDNLDLLYAEVRRVRGLGRKWKLRPKDEELIDFVETMRKENKRMSFADMLSEWNNGKNKESLQWPSARTHYKRYNSMSKAYNHAKQRLKESKV
jgi:hypothetical protein